MKFTLEIDGKPADAKDLTDTQKIGIANKMLEIADNPALEFRNDIDRISFTDCLLSGANPHAFFSKKKKLLPERIYNACNAADGVTLPKPLK